MPRLIERVVEVSVEHSQQVLVGVVALSLVVLTGFARADVDTDPARLLERATSAVDSADDEPTLVAGSSTDTLIVTIVGERSLLTPGVLGAVRSVTAEIAGLDGVEGAEVLSIADVMGSTIPSTRQELNELSETIRADTALGGVVVSADRTVLTIIAPLNSDAAKPTETADAVLTILEGDDALADQQVHVTSFALAEQRVADDLFGQMLTRTFIGWILAFVVIAVLFRQVVSAALVSAVVAGAVAWALSAASAFGPTWEVTSAAVPAAALVTALIHVARPVTAYLAHPNVLEDPRRVIASVCGDAGKAAAAADAVIVIALVVLASTVEQYRTLGWALVAAFVVSLVFSLTVVPAALAALDPKFLTVSPERDTESGALASLAWILPTAGVRFRDTVLSVVAVVVGVGAVGLATAALDDNPLRWIRGDSRLATDIEATADRGVGVTSVTMHLDAVLVNQLTARATLDGLASLEDRWAADPVIGASMSFRSVVADGDAAARRTAFETIESSHPVGEALADVDRAEARVTVWLRDGDADAVRRLLDLTGEQLDAEPLNPGIVVSWSGEGVETIEWQEQAVRDPARSMLVGVLVGMAAIVVGFRSLRWAVIAMAPAAVAYLAVFGFLGWTDGVHGVPSATGGILLVVFTVEAGIVTSVHYRRASSRTWSARDAAAEVGSGAGRGMVVAAVATAVAMLPLATSDLLPNGRSGSLLLIGAGAGGVWALVMVCATASGPPRNTAPLLVRGASPP